MIRASPSLQQLGQYVFNLNSLSPSGFQRLAIWFEILRLNNNSQTPDSLEILIYCLHWGAIAISSTAIDE
jgi:hypothetical protein